MSLSGNAASSLSGSNLRLVEFNVAGLFNEFDYTIPLNLEHHVTAIIAPNGTGKTLCLRMIYGLFQNKWDVFTDNDFTSVTFKFSDGSRIWVEKRSAIGLNLFEESPPDSTFALRITSGVGDPEVVWTPKFSDLKRLSQVERHLPFLTRVGQSKWRHDQTGELYELSEIFEDYSEILPESFRASVYGKKPAELDAIIRQIDCRLIETQRLLILKEEPDDPLPYRPSRHNRSTLAITRKAEILKETISREINAYASLSQSLDRSFPRRVIQQSPTLPTDDLKARLSELDRRRQELMEAGILDTETDDPVAFPQGAIQPAIARVLSVYADDVDSKLSSLSKILAKIRLFKELIDQRFLTKDVRISKENGIDVVSRNKNVPLGRLSSGEQHQLVLFFELLFEIDRNSLILIDEPELSLHVAWQKKFIFDLLKIIDLNRFDVVLATHSPQLIGRWNHLVVELGDVYEGEEISNQSSDNL